VSSRKLLLIATVANIIVAALTYAMLGWNSAAAHAAARNTARLALVFFLLGLAHPGLSSFLRNIPSATSWVLAFVCAQLVHFVTVIMTISLDKTHFLRHFSFAGMMVVLVGSSIVISAGYTATSTSKLVSVLHQVLLYVIFMIFFADYMEHPIHQLRFVTIVLALAVVIRVAGQMYRPKALANKASA
jgi:hypothetical protein